MAGSGVSVGGTAMLRTRRRDVSIKPNRRLDRKSSRGMIYENEELRLRTININAEVEQGQNDIKKLRRENEQLRREIWSLRDEYDKLEELVKNQSSHGSSDELDGRSGDENNVYTDNSGDEDVVEEEEEEEEDDEEEEDGEEDVEDEEEEEEDIPEDGKTKEEDLENAENQKISSEKMNSSMHRLHVEFDDLSVVDEEEELKKDKEKKDSVFSEDSNLVQIPSDLITIDKNIGNSKSNDDLNLPYFPSPAFDLRSNLTASEQKYFADCPFVFPNPSDPNYPKMLPMDNANLVMSPCSKMYEGQLTPLPNLDTPGIGPVDTIFGHDEFLVNSNYKPLASPPSFRDGFIAPSNVSSLPQRRSIRFNKPINFTNDHFLKSPNSETPNSGEQVTQNGWDFGRASETNGSINEKGASGPSSGQEKPKHFFAPLPAKLRAPRTFEETFSKSLDTATSSSSEKTSSTVVSRNYNQHHNLGRKGAADVYVHGGFPFAPDNQEPFYQSSENLLAEEVRNISRQSSNNPLIKSLSCQDLSSSDPQSLPFSEKLKMFNAGNAAITKSDNTLDNFCSTNSGRPFKSQLNVTLKLPKQLNIPPSPDTPEIPKLPAINYRLFNNPFLQSYQSQQQQQQQLSSYNANFKLECPMTRPLSVQVNEDPRNTGVGNTFNFKPRIEDPRLLLMAANQFRNIEENANSSRRPNIGFEVTSFEGPNPQTLNPVLQNQRLYQNIPNGRMVFPSDFRVLGTSIFSKVPAQTQTSIDGDSHVEEETERRPSAAKESQGPVVPGSSPLTLRRKRTLRKERTSSVKDKRPLSPAAQRRKDRLRKQNSVTSGSEALDSPVKTPTRGRKFSVTTSSSTVEVQEKNESRSSSSGQDSPKKGEQRRRVSLYFNAKKRPSLVSSNSKLDRRSSLDNIKDGRFAGRTDTTLDATTTNSERERTNSVSSRDTVTKGRKMSTGSGKVPWCACWGNGCV